MSEVKLIRRAKCPSCHQQYALEETISKAEKVIELTDKIDITYGGIVDTQSALVAVRAARQYFQTKQAEKKDE